MTDYVRVEEIIDTSLNSTMRHVSNTNETRQLTGLLMRHSPSLTQSVQSMNIRGFNLSTRAMGRSRVFPNSISSTIEQQPGISLSSLLNIQRIQNSLNTVTPPSDNFVINVEDQPTTNNVNSHDASNHDNHHYHQSTTTNNFLNYIREGAHEFVNETQHIINHNNINNSSDNDSNNNSNNNNAEENSRTRRRITPEIRTFLIKIFKKYILFVAILLAKGLYDYRADILNFIVLLVTFIHANNVVKREIAKQNNKSWTSLFVITCYIIACIVFIDFEDNTHIFFSYTRPLTLWELLWSVLITDFVLKLITIVCKVFLTCLPLKLLTIRTRGKYYLMVEATSQLYRCFLPIQPWLYYFSEAYQGPEKILGVAFSVLYAVSKIIDLSSHVKLFRTTFWKLFQNVNLGVPPSKEQLIASGGVCAICHEEYSMPIRLHCQHIFCETCVLTWLDRERSCPLCRAAITDDPIYRDGHTTYYIQLY